MLSSDYSITSANVYATIGEYKRTFTAGKSYGKRTIHSGALYY